MQSKWLRLIWPAFLSACLLEMLVFGFFDPHDLKKISGSKLPLSTEGVYTVFFFFFWCISYVNGWLTAKLIETYTQPHASDKES